MNAPTSLGERIRAGRIRKNWTQDDLCRESAISKGFLSDVENSKRGIGAGKLLAVGLALGLSLDHLVYGLEGCSTAVPLDWRPFDPAEEYGPGLYILADTDGSTNLCTQYSGNRDWEARHGAWLDPDKAWKIFGPIARPEWGDK